MAEADKRPQRPLMTDEDLRRKAAEALTANPKSPLLDGLDREDIIEQLVDATRFEIFDGYRIARELDDRHHWDCDIQIVDRLERFGSILLKLRDEAEVSWASLNPADPQFAAGDRVLWSGKPATIKEIYTLRPQCYMVVRDEMQKGFYVVPFEDTKALED